MKRSRSGVKEHHVTERCSTDKKKYTKAEAKKTAKFLKYNKKYPGFIPSVYKCKTCGWWHVGNTNSDHIS